MKQDYRQLRKMIFIVFLNNLSLIALFYQGVYINKDVCLTDILGFRLSVTFYIAAFIYIATLSMIFLLTKKLVEKKEDIVDSIEEGSDE